MKMNQVTDLIKNVVSKEIRKAIIKESKEGKIEKFTIKCEGVPMGYFDTEEEAQEAMSKMDEKKGELIIEKDTFDSYEEMMNTLDEMNDQIEEETDCQECGDKTMEENSDVDENAFVLAADAAKDAGKDEFEFPKGSGKMHKVTIKQDINKDSDEGDVNEGIPLFLPAVIKGLRKELGREPNDEEIGKEMKKLFTKDQDDSEDKKDKKKKEKSVKEGDETCNECGSMLNEEGVCNECGKSMYESKKKVLRLKESEMIDAIKKIIKESHPGLVIANRSRKESGVINKKSYSDTGKNIGKFLELGKDEEFPIQNKESELDKKVVNKVNNTPKEDEVVDSQRGRGLENLEYDHEPSEIFKKRLKMAIEGDTLMGNSQEAANVIKNKTGDKVLKSAKRKEKEANEEPLYSKEPTPVKNVNEEKNSLSSILLEEIKKMKHMGSYNKKTQ